MTSMNGVTLISCVSAKSLSSSSSVSAIDAPIALLRRARMRRTMGAIQIARQQSRRGARGAPEQLKVGFRHAREMVVDDDGRDRRGETERGGEQRFRDAGCYNGKIRRLRFRNADKAVHDTPHRAEQPDERRRRPYGRQQSHAEADPARFGAHDLGKARCRPFLDTAVAGNSRRQPRRAPPPPISAKPDPARPLIPPSREIPADSRASRIAADSNDDNTPSFAPSANCASASDLASLILPSAARSLRRIRDSSIIFAMKMVHVTSEAKARPIITALTRTSAERNIDQGDSSRSAGAVDFSDLLPPSAGVAVASDAAGAEADGTTADGAGACTGGAACAGIAGGCCCDSAGAC